MPYRHGFLTERLRKYLEVDRKDMKINERTVYDFHVRESLKQALNDMNFILEKLDKKQFDKISDDLYEEFVKLLQFFSEKCYVDTSNLKYPFGRIRKYRELVYATRPRTRDVLQKLAQDTLDRIYGEDYVIAWFLSAHAYSDFREWFDKNRDGVIRWRSIPEEKTEK